MHLHRLATILPAGLATVVFVGHSRRGRLVVAVAFGEARRPRRVQAGRPVRWHLLSRLVQHAAHAVGHGRPVSFVRGQRVQVFAAGENENQNKFDIRHNR